MNDDESEETLDPQKFTDQSPDPAKDVELSVLCDALQEHGIKRVVVRYQGSGDEGSIDEVEFEPADVQLPEWIVVTLEDVAEFYCPDGYENNEGGYGALIIHPFDGLAELEHFDRYEDFEAIEVQPATLTQGLHRRLTQLGVQRASAHFNGYSDSGGIEELEVEPESITIGSALAQDLENFLLEVLPAGWELNEGSFGEFIVDVPVGRVQIDAFWRVDKDSEPQVIRWKWRQ